MPSFMKLDWDNWLYGLFAGFIGGGAGAVVSGVTASMMVPDRLAFGGPKFFMLIGIVFLAHGCISGFMYLNQNPLPKKITVDETTLKTFVVDDGRTTATETALKTTTTVTENKQ